MEKQLKIFQSENTGAAEKEQPLDTLRRLLSCQYEHISISRREAVFEKLIKMAENGNIAAIRLLLTYDLGVPQRITIESSDDTKGKATKTTIIEVHHNIPS